MAFYYCASLEEHSCRFCHKNIYIIANKTWHSTDGCHWANGHVAVNKNVYIPPDGRHWLDGRVVLAKEYIYYIVNKTWLHSPVPCC